MAPEPLPCWRIGVDIQPVLPGVTKLMLSPHTRSPVHPLSGAEAQELLDVDDDIKRANVHCSLHLPNRAATLIRVSLLAQFRIFLKGVLSPIRKL